MAPGPKLNPGGVEIHQTDASQPGGGALTQGLHRCPESRHRGALSLPAAPRAGRAKRAAPGRPPAAPAADLLRPTRLPTARGRNYTQPIHPSGLRRGPGKSGPPAAKKRPLRCVSGSLGGGAGEAPRSTPALGSGLPLRAETPNRLLGRKVAEAWMSREPRVGEARALAGDPAPGPAASRPSANARASRPPGIPCPTWTPALCPRGGSHRFGGLGRSLNEGRGRPWRETGKFQNQQGLEEVQPPNRAPEERPEAGPGSRRRTAQERGRVGILSARVCPRGRAAGRGRGRKGRKLRPGAQWAGRLSRAGAGEDVGERTQRT